MRYIDLRSDTVTMPTDEMRKAMANAEVGDDVYEDDPTVIRLEKLAAEMTGKEAGLFVTSGTMGNQIGIMAHTSYGDEIIANRKCHIVINEVGAAARLSGVNYNLVDNPDGFIYGKDVAERIRHKDIHYPKTSLLCLENPLSDGRVVPLEIMKEASDVARGQGVAVHLDGARLFNAALALSVDAKEVAKYADSVMFCLSKGLCSPVGSMLCGTREFIEKARRMRKILGGGMRQAGVIAAPGIISLEKMTKRLQEDHDNAKYLAKKLLEFPFIELNIDNVQINMVFFRIKKDDLDTDKFTEFMLENGVKINPEEDNNYRFVTTNDMDRDDIDRVLDLMGEYLE